MDTTITVAVIGAVGAVVAAATALLKSKPETQATQSSTNIGNVSAGRDAIVAGRDAIIIQQQILEERFISKQGAQLITKVSSEIIAEEATRRQWNSLDAKFLDQCVKDTPRGMVFDAEAFQRFRKPEYDLFFELSVKIYLACCKHVDDKSKDYDAFNKIAQLYLAARISMREM